MTVHMTAHMAAQAEGLSGRHMRYHRILRLPPHEVDPVQIISAAYVQLRRWRSGDHQVPEAERLRRVWQIITARDAMLRHVLDGRTVTRRRSMRHGRIGVGTAESRNHRAGPTTTSPIGLRGASVEAKPDDAVD